MDSQASLMAPVCWSKNDQFPSYCLRLCSFCLKEGRANISPIFSLSGALRHPIFLFVPQSHKQTFMGFVIYDLKLILKSSSLEEQFSLISMCSFTELLLRTLSVCLIIGPPFLHIKVQIWGTFSVISTYFLHFYCENFPHKFQILCI